MGTPRTPRPLYDSQASRKSSWTPAPQVPITAPADSKVVVGANDSQSTSPASIRASPAASTASRANRDVLRRVFPSRNRLGIVSSSTSPRMVQLMTVGSRFAAVRIPDSPASSRSHKSPALGPSDEIAPRPVTTTRRLGRGWFRSNCVIAFASASVSTGSVGYRERLRALHELDSMIEFDDSGGGGTETRAFDKIPAAEKTDDESRAIGVAATRGIDNGCSKRWDADLL